MKKKASIIIGLIILIITVSVIKLDLGIYPWMTETFDFGYADQDVDEMDKVSKQTNILFVGDMMFDRSVARIIEKNGIDSIFENIKEIFQGNDAIIGNLEGTITDNASLAQKDNSILRFTFSPKIAEFLKKSGFTAVSLANNHSADFYDDGYNQTVNHLTAQDVDYFGNAFNNGKLSTTLTVNDEQICLIGYHDLYTYDELPIINEISKIRADCTYIIVFAHWGNEYEIFESPRQQALGRKFIDAGADLIIGAHPHVVQPVEIYDGKAIFYSLGNFVFDQRLSWNTEHSLAVLIELNSTSTIFTQIPITLLFSSANVASSSDKLSIIQRTGQSEYFSLPRH